jgi:uncharacterized protein DUF4365
MTRTTQQGRTGQWGFDYVKSIVETGWGCILQEFQGARDVGMDATVLDAHNGRTTPHRFDLQVRTSEHYAPHPDGFTVTISREHRALWSQLNIPMFLVCVDARPGTETKAFWRRITSEDALGGSIFVPRRNVFGPVSRGQILAEIRRSLPKELPAVRGMVLGCPLHVGLRAVAKQWYRSYLIALPVDNGYFGPIHFTWQGWRHITRHRRSRARIHASLLILPSVRAVLRDPMLPAGIRPLDPIRRGAFDYARTLLAFDRTVTFATRSPAVVRVVVKQADQLPVDWARRPPDAPERLRGYTFYSVEELAAEN